MRFIFGASAAALLAATVIGCSGGGGMSYNNPSSPSPSTPTNTVPSNAVVITITSNNGAQSFSPNPASVPDGQVVVWRNADSITHRVLLNDGTVDTGDLAPGATSAAMTLRTNGANYHCSLHPTMVGSINSTSTGAPPPCTGRTASTTLRTFQR